MEKNLRHVKLALEIDKSKSEAPNISIAISDCFVDSFVCLFFCGCFDAVGR